MKATQIILCNSQVCTSGFVERWWTGLSQLTPFPLSLDPFTLLFFLVMSRLHQKTGNRGEQQGDRWQCYSRSFCIPFNSLSLLSICLFDTFKQSPMTKTQLCVKADGAHLNEFAFIAGSELLDVTHGLILRDGGLIFTRPQHWQGWGKERERHTHTSFTQTYRQCDVSKTHTLHPLINRRFLPSKHIQSSDVVSLRDWWLFDTLF